MIRYNVIGGTYEQARQWCNRHQHLDLDAKFVPISHADQLKGFTNPRGILVGTWLSNPNISTILTNLVCQTFNHNPGLDKAIKLYQEHINNTSYNP